MGMWCRSRWSVVLVAGLVWVFVIASLPTASAAGDGGGESSPAEQESDEPDAVEEDGDGVAEDEATEEEEGVSASQHDDTGTEPEAAEPTEPEAVGTEPEPTGTEAAEDDGSESGAAEVEEADPPVDDGLPEGFVPGVDDVPGPDDEILGHTPFSRWWRKPGGTIAQEFFARPVFFEEPEGVWHEIDASLRLADDETRFAPVAMPDGAAVVTATIAPAVPVVEVGPLTRRVGMRHPGLVGPVAGELVADGSVRFADALGAGRHVIVGVTPSGWKDLVILPDASAASYRVQFDVPVGTVAVENGRGGIDFADGLGETFAIYGDGSLAYDSAEVPAETDVVVSLVRQVSTVVTVEVSVDAAWLADPGRVFPVVVDPTYNYPKYSWTMLGGWECASPGDTYTPCDVYVNSDNFNGAYWSQDRLRIGSPGFNYEQGTTKPSRTRTFLMFPTDSYGTGSSTYGVKEATISIWSDWARSSTAYTYQLYESSSRPTYNTTWGTQPGVVGGPVASVQVAGHRYHAWDVQPLADAWFRGTKLNRGVSIWACCDEHDVNRYKTFLSSNAWGGPETNTSRYPRFWLEYYPRPSAPTSVSRVAGDRAFTVNWQPPSDTGGTSILGYYVRLYQSGGSQVGSTASLGSSVRSHTFTGLTNGTSYYARVSARNTSGEGTRASSGSAIPDGTPPTTPSVSSSTHPSQNTWYTNDGPCFAWSASDPETGVNGYSWVLDQSSSTTPNTTEQGTGTSTCYSGRADGEWWFHVRARNGRVGANMWGAARHYRVRIDKTPPPAPSLSSSTHPDANTWYANAAPTFSWSASDTSGINGYSWVLDQNPSTTPNTTSQGTATSTSYSNLADGEWWFHVRARNGSGLWGPASHHRIRVDESPPEGLAVTSASHPDEDAWLADDNPAFSWSASDPHSGVDGYSWVLDQNPSTTPNTTSQGTATSTSFDEVADGEWWFHVAARNAAGLWSAPVHYRVRVDVTPPEAPDLGSPTHPDPTGWYASTDPTFSWDADDTSGITGYSYVLDQSPSTVPNTASQGTGTSTSYSSLTDGEWWFHVRARNGSGLWGDPTHLRVQIDTAAPSPPDVVSSTHPDQDVWYPEADVALAWTATADSGIDGYSWVLDQNPATTPDLEVAGTQTTIGYSDLDDAEWWFHIRARSGAGIWGGTVHYRLRIDVTPPAPGTITSSTHPNPAAWYPNSSPSVTWSYTDVAPIDGYSYVLDQSSATVPDPVVGTTTPSRSWSGLADGEWWLHVRARNASGLWSDTTHFRFRIDATPPEIPAVSSPTHPSQDAWSANNSPSFAWASPQDTSGIVGYSWTFNQSATTTPNSTLDTNAAGGNTSDSFSNVADGTWYLHVRARNGAGLWSPTEHYRVRIDATPPTAPTVSSSTHPSTTTWYPNANPKFSWSASDTSGITGYSWVLDTNSSTTPNTSVNGTGTSTSYTNRADGEWWFHIRARNGSGLWGATRHRRVRIDATPPAPPVITSSTHPEPGAWYTNRNPSFAWSASDTSGISGYSYGLNRNPSSTPNKTSQGTGTTTSYSDRADGEWWLHVRARNGAGLWGRAGHYRIGVIPPCSGTSNVAVNQPVGVAFASGRVTLAGVVPEAGSRILVYRDSNANGVWNSSDALIATDHLTAGATYYEVAAPLEAGRANCLFVRAVSADGQRTYGPTAAPVVFAASGSGGGGGTATAGSAGEGEDEDEDEGVEDEPEHDPVPANVPGQLAVRFTTQSVTPEMIVVSDPLGTGLLEELGPVVGNLVATHRIFPGAGEDEEPLNRWWYLQVPAGEEFDLAASLASHPLVEVVEPVPNLRTAQAQWPDDNFYRNGRDAGPGRVAFRRQRDYLDSIQVESGWEATNGGQGTRRIAIIDSGVYYGSDGQGDLVHPDLVNKLATAEFDCVSSGSSCASVNTPEGPVWHHGTLVAGVAVAETNNAATYPDFGGGIASVGFDTEFLSYRVIDGNNDCRSFRDEGFCFAPEAIRHAAVRAVSQNVGVINLSLTLLVQHEHFQHYDDDGWPDHWQDVINIAGRLGVSVVGAAGNPLPAQVGQDRWPARGHGAVAVGGTDIDAFLRARGEYGDIVSNAANWVDLAAPSTQIATTFAPEVAAPGNPIIRDQFDFMPAGGTSLATPMVSAAVALLTSTQSNDVAAWQRPPLRAEHRVRSGVTRFLNRDLNLGYGHLNVGAAFFHRATRLFGLDSWQTAVEISREVYPGGFGTDWLPNAVVLAVGSDAPTGAPRFADALAAGGLAAQRNAPVLLVNDAQIAEFGSRRSVVRNEIARTLGCPTPPDRRTGVPQSRPTMVYVIGGAAAIGDGIYQALDDCFHPVEGYDIQRVEGATRYHTAVAVAEEILAHSTMPHFFPVALTSGEAFPDAMVMSTWAARREAPLLLTPGGSLHPAVEEFLRTHRNRILAVHIAGGPAAVSAGVEQAVRDIVGSSKVQRHAGADRYQTAVAVAEGQGLFPNPAGVVVATGNNWPDAIAGSTLGRIGREISGWSPSRPSWPLLLTPSPPTDGDDLGPALHPAARDYIAARANIQHAYVLGGTAAIGMRVVNTLNHTPGLLR